MFIYLFVPALRNATQLCFIAFRGLSIWRVCFDAKAFPLCVDSLGLVSRAIVHAEPETFEVHHISCLDKIETDSYNLIKTSMTLGAVCLRCHHEFLCQVRSFQLRLKGPKILWLFWRLKRSQENKRYYANKKISWTFEVRKSQTQHRP